MLVNLGNIGMEIIIKITEGEEPKPSKCKFCNNLSTKVFGVINLEDKRYNGFQTKGFLICNKHLKALNSLIDGTKDINTLVINYDRIMTGGKLNLRAHI